MVVRTHLPTTDIPGEKEKKVLETLHITGQSSSTSDAPTTNQLIADVIATHEAHLTSVRVASIRLARLAHRVLALTGTFDSLSEQVQAKMAELATNPSLLADRNAQKMDSWPCFAKYRATVLETARVADEAQRLMHALNAVRQSVDVSVEFPTPKTTAPSFEIT